MQRNKIYKIGFAVIFLVTLQTPISYLIFGQTEKGRVVELIFEKSGIVLLPASSYPRIEFKYQNKIFSILGEENENLLVGEEVKVIFFKNKPSEAKVLTWSGLFISTIIQLPIACLIWWALFKSFPDLFRTTNDQSQLRVTTVKRRIRKTKKISDEPIATQILIYLIISIVVLFLVYTTWNIYTDMKSGAISYEMGFGVLCVILIILSSAVYKIFKG